jgi:putative membrane protein
MMLPGLSGSFILILLGNYELLLVRAVADLNIIILSVFSLGSLFGLLSFSHLLSWLLKKYKDQTLATLTGFIAGSLAIIWPWKEVKESIRIGNKEKIIDYQLLFPQELNQENIIAIILIMIGIVIVYAIEKFSFTKK